MALADGSMASCWALEAAALPPGGCSSWSSACGGGFGGPTTWKNGFGPIDGGAPNKPDSLLSSVGSDASLCAISQSV